MRAALGPKVLEEVNIARLEIFPILYLKLVAKEAST